VELSSTFKAAREGAGGRVLPNSAGKAATLRLSTYKFSTSQCVKKLYQIQSKITNVPGAKRSNHRYEVVEQVPITNSRTHGPKVQLNKEGFQLVELPESKYESREAHVDQKVGGSSMSLRRKRPCPKEVPTKSDANFPATTLYLSTQVATFSFTANLRLVSPDCSLTGIRSSWWPRSESWTCRYAT